MNVEDMKVTVALASERRRATHSGTGDGSGTGADMAIPRDRVPGDASSFVTAYRCLFSDGEDKNFSLW